MTPTVQIGVIFSSLIQYLYLPLHFQDTYQDFPLFTACIIFERSSLFSNDFIIRYLTFG